MQELKMQNGLLLQLVKGLQNQINSKNRENHIMFQQYEQLAADNSSMRAQIDSFKSKQREQTLETFGNSPRQQEHLHLKQKISSLEEHVKELVVQLDQKGGTIILLQSQLQQLKSKLLVYQKQQKDETEIKNFGKNEITTGFGVSVFNQQFRNKQSQLSAELGRKIESYEAIIREKETNTEQVLRENVQLKQKMKSFQNLQAKNTKAEEEMSESLKQLKTILASKQQTIIELGQFLSAITTKSQEAAEKQQQLQNNLKQALSRMLRMEEESDQLKSKLAQAKQQKEKQLNEENNAINQITTYNSSADIDEIHVKLSTNEDQLQRAKQIITEKENFISQSFERINQLTERIKELQTLCQKEQGQRVSNPINEQQPKEEQLAKVKQVLAEKQHVVQQCFETINQLTQKIKQLEVYSQQNEPIESLQNQIKAKDQTIAELSQYLNDQLKTITQLTCKVKQLEDIKLDENTKQKQQLYQSQTEKIREIQHLLKNKEESLLDMSAYIQENNLKLAKLQQNLNSLVLQHQLLQQKFKISSSINQNGQAHHSDETKEIVKQLQQKVRSKQLIISEFTEFMNEQSARFTTFQEQKNKFIKEEIAKYEDMVVSLKQRAKVYEEMVRQKEEFINKLQTQLGQKQLQIKQLQKDISEDNTQKQVQTSSAELKMQQFQQILSKQGSLIITLTQKIQDLQQRQCQLQKELQQVQKKYVTINDQLLRKVALIQQLQEGKTGQRVNNSSHPNQDSNFETNIAQLEAIIKSKSDTIAELSQFMNEQATTIAQLQAQIQNTQPQADNSQKIADLQAIIKMKEQSVQELRQYLEENTAKMVELQTKLAQLQSQSSKSEQQISQSKKQQQLQMLQKQQEFIQALEHLQNAATQKKELLRDLQLAIDQKQSELQHLKKQYVDKQKSVEELSKTLEQYLVSSQNLVKQEKQLQNNVTQLHQTLNGLKKERQDAQNLLKDLIEQINTLQSQLTQKKANPQEVSSSAKEESQWQILYSQKQQEVNVLSEILQTLQDQLRSKNQIIQYLQARENDNPSNVQETKKAQNIQANESIKQHQQRIDALQSQNQNLRAQHQQLTQRLDSMQQSNILQEKYEIISMQRQLGLQSKIIAESYRKQLEELRSSGERKSPPLQQQTISKDEQNVMDQERPLTASQILSQLLIYSQEGSNLKDVKHLLRSLNNKYLSELQAFQAENKLLKDQASSLAAIKEDLLQKINELNSQMFQLNQEINEKNQLIESLHQLNGEKEKSFNEKMQQIRNSIQVSGTEFFLNFSNKQFKQGQQPKAEVNAQQVVKEQIQVLANENKELRQQVKELREEMQALIDEDKLKSQQLQSLKSNKSPTIEKEFVDLLRDSNSNINEDGTDSHQEMEKLLIQKDKLSAKSIALEGKVEQLEQENKQLKQTVQELKKQLNEYNSQKAVPSSGKVLKQLYQKKQDEKLSEPSEQRDQLVAGKLMEKNEIIAELQETVLKLQKGYNAEIMQLRRSNAQLNAEILALTKKVFLLDPNAVDIADFIKESCKQALSETEYYKSRFNLKYNSHYSRADQPHNSSYLTQQQSRSRRYEPFFTHKELNLGEKIIGRPCRGDPLNYTVNNDFRLNSSIWEVQGSRPL